MPRKIVSICDFKIKAEVIQLYFKKELKKIEDEKTFNLATFDSWKRGTRPTLKKLESFCDLIGLPVTNIMKPLNEFAQTVADIKGEKPEDILAFIRGIRQQNALCQTDKDEGVSHFLHKRMRL